MDYFKHLNNIKESYFEHFCKAINLSLKLIYMSGKNIIHAFYPDFFSDAVSSGCQDILDKRYQKKDYINLNKKLH